MLAQVSSPNLNKDRGQSVGPSNFLKNYKLGKKRGLISSQGEHPDFGTNIRGLISS
jgi:hypothetical protein